MKKRNLIVKRKAKKKKTLVKNNKIKAFYKVFEKFLKKNINKSDFSIAVSGGSDSLCLAYFSKLYAQKNKNKLHTLIVNHNLRKNSYEEAAKVKNILINKDIKSTILNWDREIPTANIQNNARNIRYSLISNYCSKRKIKYLITAHHLDDQVENFFIRLFRGSGVTGLSSMSEIISYNDNLKILRPFLAFNKNDIRKITLSYFKNFIEDPTNKDEKFLRSRIRKYRSSMEKEGLDTNKIIKTVNNLSSANKALDFYKEKALYKHVTFHSKSKCFINKKLFSEDPEEIVFRLFSDLLSLVSNTYYPPRSKKIANLIKRIKKNNFSKSTLGGCIIEKKDTFISVSKEHKKPRSLSIQL